MNLIKQSAGVCACLDVSRNVWMQLHCTGFWHMCVIQMRACSEILAEIQKNPKNCAYVQMSKLASK